MLAYGHLAYLLELIHLIRWIMKMLLLFRQVIE
ncbi:hypothetical protein CJA_3576 [Cellvibrio japonicus Ueda107]|uniref:Uncharacterized protein n=1 Tax=Cellvibrio japonicus (strain Ueda107) TaxID=498211 RepID=B3PGY2_CELJU|nr:hypothetical protein CJA_3576 [Cellvibrio japonicus Ueda107]